MTLEAAALHLMSLISAVTGMKAAVDYPTEKAVAFPFALAFPARGRSHGSVPGAYVYISTLVLEIHVARKNIETSVSSVYPFLERVLNLLHDPGNRTLGGNVSHIIADRDSGGVTWTFGELNWGDMKTVGWRFEIEVKQENTI